MARTHILCVAFVLSLAQFASSARPVALSLIQVRATRSEVEVNANALNRTIKAAPADPATEVILLGERNAQKRESGSGQLCDGIVHFFSDGDCGIFESQELCATARTSRTFLASYPSSGNTWTRMLLEQLTGIYTGSIYDDGTLRAVGMEGEGHQDPSEVLVVKTHFPTFDAGVACTAPRAVVLIRQPLEAALSFATLGLAARSGAPSPHAAEIEYAKLRPYFDQYRDKLLLWWEKFTKYWLGMGEDSYQGEVLIVRFEKLVADTSGVLSNGVIPFLGLSAATLQDRLSCAIDATYEGTRRNHTYTFEFSSDDKTAMSELISEEVLERAGYA